MISSNFASVSAENSSAIFLGVDDREWSIEDRVCAGVAAYSSFHFSIFHPQSSIFDFLASAVALAADHVDHPEGRDNIRDHVTLDHLVKGAHGNEARRAHSDSIGSAPAVAHNIETQLSVAPFHGEISLAGRHMDSFHDDLEMMHQPFDAV